jgi:F-type H+-transporting ATPase subunit epsilon
MVESSMPTRGEGSRTLQCVVVTPEETVLDETADFVALPLFDGELGVAPGRSPLIGRLGYGELRLVSQGRTERYYVDGGFVQVADDVVSLLTNRAMPAEKVDHEAATRLLAEARGQHAASTEEFAARDRAESQARAQLRIAGHKSGTAHH